MQFLFVLLTVGSPREKEEWSIILYFMSQIHTTLKRNSDFSGIKSLYPLSSWVFMAGEHQHWELSSEEAALLSEMGLGDLLTISHAFRSGNWKQDL